MRELIGERVSIRFHNTPQGSEVDCRLLEAMLPHIIKIEDLASGSVMWIGLSMVAIMTPYHRMVADEHGVVRHA